MKIFRLSLLLLALVSPVMAQDSAKKTDPPQKGGGAPVLDKSLFKPAETACWGDYYCYANPEITYECCDGLACQAVCEDTCRGHCDGYDE
ncbi:MAG: hypothetical protein ABJC13_00995 [Acidobacteriota bacterium]